MAESEITTGISTRALRQKRIIRVGLWGVAVNFLYAVLKSAIGYQSGSIAVFLDAMNNLNDAVSSVIAIGGIKLATMPADRKHPFGHGRIEYISAMVISALIVVLGVTSLVNATEKIINPTRTHYNITMIMIMCTGVVAKLWLGLYTIRAGKREKSDLLNASATENLFDSFVTLATIVSAVILMAWGIDLDGWFAAAISLILIKAGWKILRRTFNDLLGRRVDSSLSTQIKQTVGSFPNVCGAYDLIVNNYGHDRNVGSINIEVPERMTAREIHALSQDIHHKVMDEYNVYLVVGIYSRPDSKEDAELRQRVEHAVTAHQGAQHIHGFLANGQEVSFHVVCDFKVKNGKEFCLKLKGDLERDFPGHTFNISPDMDYCD